MWNAKIVEEKKKHFVIFKGTLLKKCDFYIDLACKFTMYNVTLHCAP